MIATLNDTLDKLTLREIGSLRNYPEAEVKAWYLSKPAWVRSCITQGMAWAV